MARRSAEFYTRIRARVDDGRVACGSSAHAALMDYEVSVSRLPARDREILRLASQGWTHIAIAESFNLDRSRVSQIVGAFLGDQDL